MSSIGRAKTAGALGRSRGNTAGKQRAKTAGSRRASSGKGEDGYRAKSVLYDSDKPPMMIDIKFKADAAGGNDNEIKGNKKKKKKKKKKKSSTHVAQDAGKSEESSKPEENNPKRDLLSNLRSSLPRTFYLDEKGGIQRVCQKFKAAPEKRPRTVCIDSPRGTLDHLAVLNMARSRLCPISPKDHPGGIVVQYVARNVINNTSGLPDTWYITLDTTFEAKELLRGLRWRGTEYSVRRYDEVMNDEYGKYLRVQNMSSFVSKISSLGVLHQKTPTDHRIKLPTLWQQKLGADSNPLERVLKTQSQPGQGGEDNDQVENATDSGQSETPTRQVGNVEVLPQQHPSTPAELEDVQLEDV